uniref:Uncharacterized protein n=1 Tax=Phasianus colchicus TaxID=9054 RepID=A0A669QHY1_PHACC
MSMYSQSMHTHSTHRHDICAYTDSHGNHRQTHGVLTQTQALPAASSHSPLWLSREKVSSIPSVIIEPVLNNEGEGEEHDVIVNESKDAAAEMGTQGTDSETSQVGSEQKPTEEIQTAPSQDQLASAGDTASDMPPGFLFKVCLFVFLLDIFSDLASTTADSIKESEWFQYRDANSYKGLFPENFTRHLE